MDHLCRENSHGDGQILGEVQLMITLMLAVLITTTVVLTGKTRSL
jgi:hypothetical protein